MQIYLDCFPGGKHKAFTMSYDDGLVYDKRLAALFDKCGIRATFHLNSGFLGRRDYITEEDVKVIFRNHEVSVHTRTHPFLADIPREMMVSEILEDREALESLVGYPVRGMSYPYSSYSDFIVEMLPTLGMEYARIVDTDYEFKIPFDFLRWCPTCHHDDIRLMELAKNFLELKASRKPRLMNVWGHSYEFERNGNWQAIEAFSEFIGNRDDIWYATNIEIVDYINALKNLRFSASCQYIHNPSAIDVWITAGEQPVKIAVGATVRI